MLDLEARGLFIALLTAILYIRLIMLYTGSAATSPCGKWP